MREEIQEMERVLLAGVDTGEEEDFERSMKELKSLAEACNMQVAGMITQRLDMVNKALYIGSGKVEEVKEYARTAEADMVIFDNALSPTQLRNLQQELDMPVMDRTSLILDIFSVRAQTREAKLQVETARLQYMLPRLVGMHEALSRQGGTSGSMSSRGAGEKKIELDRRKIEHRIAELQKELKDVAKDREIQRRKRIRSEIPQVSLVGYTNAGKSTLMNRMVEYYVKDETKRVLEKDMLFATLETAVRSIDGGNNRPFYLTDTVGFIHKLPHGLIKAFRSTLEEVKNADLLLHVVDFSDEGYKQQMKVTEETLKELEAGSIPVIHIYNKAEGSMENLPKIQGNQIYMSAKSGRGIPELVKMITDILYAGNSTASFFIPYDKGQIASYLQQNGSVVLQEYVENGIHLVVNCRPRDQEKYKEYLQR